MTGRTPSPAGTPASFWTSARTQIAIAVGLFCLAFAVFFPVHLHEFINYDDPDYVTSNPYVQRGLTGEGLRWAFTRLHGESTYWHPITWLSHMLDIELFGPNAGAHHLVNSVIHAFNASLVFLTLSRLTGNRWRSAAVAALFAVHPLQVDTVAWIAERKNVLSTFWLLLTILCYQRYVRCRKAAWYAATFCVYVVGLMTKPMLVVVPGILLLIDFWPLGRCSFAKNAPRPLGNPPSGWTETISKLLLEKIPFLLPAIGSALLTVLAHERLGIDPSVRGLSLWDRIGNALVSYVRYLEKFFWPHDLTIFYPHPVHWPLWMVMGSALILAAVSAVAVRRWNRSPWLLFGWLWFLGTLVPVLGVVQAGLQAMAERFAYVPVIGLLVAVVWTGSQLLQKHAFQRVFIWVMTVIACIGVTERQLSYWKNSERLWRHALSVTKGNFIAEHNLAHVLTLKEEFPEAWQHVQEALRLKPNLIEAYYTAGYIQDRQRHYEQAIPFYQEAVKRKADWAAAHRALLDAYYNAGKTNAAIEHLQGLLRVAPENPGGHLELALALQAENRMEEAIEEYREILKLAPDWIHAANNLAWILATCPQDSIRNGAEAVSIALRACEQSRWREPILIGTLAAAYAEAGQFDLARETAQKAAAAAEAVGQDEIAARNRRLLEMYKRNQPYRETGPF